MEIKTCDCMHKLHNSPNAHKIRQETAVQRSVFDCKVIQRRRKRIKVVLNIEEYRTGDEFIRALVKACAVVTYCETAVHNDMSTEKSTLSMQIL